MEKSTRWAFTAFEEQWDLFESKPELVKWWAWQTEKAPDTGRLHFQGALLTTRQVRFAQLKKLLPGVHIEVAKNWDALLNYCKKEESRVEGGKHNWDDIPRQTLTMAQALIKVAQHRDAEVKCGSDELAEIAKWKGYQYDTAVSSILTEDPDLVGLYAQPIFRNAWIKWSSVFIQKADCLEESSGDRQTDRQTEG